MNYAACLTMIVGMMSADQGAEPVPSTVLAWKLGSQFNFAVVLGHRSGNDHEVTQAVYSKAKRIADLAGVAIPRLPGKLELPSLLNFLNKSNRELSKQLTDKYSIEHGALYEMAAKSVVLLLIYELEEEKFNQGFADSIAKCGKATRLPDPLWLPYVKLIKSKSPYSEIKSAVLRMDNNVTEHLFRAGEKDRQGDSSADQGAGPVPSTALAWKLGSQFNFAVVLGHRSGNDHEVTQAVYSKAKAIADHAGVAIPRLPGKLELLDLLDFLDKTNEALSENLADKYGIEHSVLYELASKSVVMLLIYELENEKINQRCADSIASTGKATKLPDPLWLPYVKLIESKSPYDEIESAVLRMDNSVTEYLLRAGKNGKNGKKDGLSYKPENSPENLKALFELLHQTVHVKKDVKQAAALFQTLIPDEARAKKALKEDIDAEALRKIVDQHKKMEVREADAENFAQPKQTVVKVHAATTEEIAKYEKGSVAFKEFPGGAQILAKQVLRPGVTFYEVEFLEPGEELGMKFHLFYWDGEQWSMLGPMWRVLK